MEGEAPGFSTAYAEYVDEGPAGRNQSFIALGPAQLVPYPPLPEIHCGAVDLMGEPPSPLLLCQSACAAVDAVTKVVVPSWDP